MPLVIGALLFATYALPLFWPPATAPLRTDAGLLERLYPGVPALWSGLRLLALGASLALLSRAATSRARGDAATGAPFVTCVAGVTPTAAHPLRLAALAAAVALLATAPSAGGFGPGGQLAYLAALALPALLLALPAGTRSTTSDSPIAATWRDGIAPLAVVAAWLALCAARDVGSPRTMDVVDGWRAVVAVHAHVARGGSVLADLLDLDLPGLGALAMTFVGVPFFQATGTTPTIPAMQAVQLAWVALTGLGIAALAWSLVGRRTAAVAAAAFLFAPYTRFVGMLPGPFVVGPLYVVAIALCVVAVWQRRSEAALAALGALAGAALTMPGVIPVAGCLTLAALWRVRREWREAWVGLAGFTATFLAVVIPAATNVIRPERMGQHFGTHGIAALLDRALLGQLPVGTFAAARASQVQRPLEIVLGALLEPFANPRLSIRLWGDAIFDPLTALLFGLGLIACVRASRREAGARLALVLLLATLAPAFVSPVDIVDIVHAAAISVPVALLAAAGFRHLAGLLPGPERIPAAAVLVATACAVGGMVLFDVAGPRVLGSSATRLAVQAVAPADADRAIVLDHPTRYGIDARWAFVGPIAALGGERPLGYMRWDGAPPVADLAADGRTLLLWSPGLEADLGVTATVCRAWPDATLYSFSDAAGLGSVLAARVGGGAWQPRLAPATTRRCNAPAA
ncbi:MAG: hypothetical protein U0842_11040 [Candidatus Binatia bacterium]